MTLSAINPLILLNDRNSYSAATKINNPKPINPHPRDVQIGLLGANAQRGVYRAVFAIVMN